MIIPEYVQPVPDRLLYHIGHRVNLYGNSDIEDLIQEARIHVWQLWQDIAWSRNKSEPGNPVAFYAKVAQRKMQSVCYGKQQFFGGVNRRGSQDALYRADRDIDDPESFREPSYEVPYEALDQFPAELIAYAR